MINLYRHQKIALSYLRLNDSFALFMEQGTGKTIPVLLRINELLSSGKALNALVVAPKPVLGSWTRDIDKLFGSVKNSSLQSLELINYDMVWRRKEFFAKKWDIIVLDEAHNIKTHTSKRSKALLRMSLNAKYRYILTGTPVGNGALENLWSQFTFLYPIAGTRSIHCAKLGSYQDFLQKYCVLNIYHKPYRYLNVNELQEIIDESSYKVKKEDCLDLPDKLPDEIYDIESPNLKYYSEMAEYSTIEKFDILAENPIVRNLRLRQLCSGFVQDIDIDSAKINVLKEFLENWNKKLVIFCEFTKSIDRVDDLLNNLKIKHCVLDGRTKNKEVWKNFQSDESLKIIVCQYQCGNQGIDLFSADTILYYEPTIRSVLLEQSRDRIHRIGQTTKCSYIHFITKGTVEADIYKTLLNYQDFSEKLFEEHIKSYTKGGKIR